MKQLSLFIICSLLTASLLAQESKDYAKIKLELNDKIFGTADPYFKDNTLPEQYKNESAIVLAQKHSLESDSKYKFRVFGHSGVKYNFFDIFRKKLLINDQSALEEYSQLNFTKLQSKSWSPVGKLKNYTFINIRLIKPNGTIKTIDVDESAVTIKDAKNLKENKIAIPDLSVGDIIDYYVANYYQEDDDAATTPLSYVLGDDYPVVNYIISLQFDGRIAAEYQSINGAPDFKISPDADGSGHVLNMLVKNVPKIKGLLWSSIYRQLPIIRLHYRRGKIVRPGMGDIKEGDVVKTTNRYPDLIEENMATILNQVCYAGPSTNNMYYYARTRTRKAWNEYVSKHPKADRPDSIACFVFRFLNWNDNFSDFNLQTNFNNAYHPLELGDQLDKIVRFGYILLWEFKAEIDVVVACSKNGFARENLFSVGDLSFLARTKEGKPLYFSFADNFDFQNSVPYYLEGEQAKVYPLQPKKRAMNAKLLSVDKDESSLITLPSTDYNANHETESLTASIDNTTQTITVKRKVTTKGFLKKDAQAYLTIYEEMGLQTGVGVGITDDMIALNSKGGKAAKKQEDELRTVLDKARTKHKEDFENEIQRSYDTKAKELKSYKIANFGTQPDMPFEFEVEFDMEGWIKKAGNNYIIDFGKFITSQVEIKKEQRERIKDIYMPFPRSYSYHIELTIPDGYTTEGIDKLTMKSENETGGFVSAVSKEGNKLVVDINKYYIHSFEPAARWPLIVSFLDKAQEFSQQKILLKKI